MNHEELQDWAHETCFEISSASDLKEICKARGFSNAPKSSGKSALAEFVEIRITGPQGVREALATLDAPSVWALHALKCAASPVGIGEIHFFYWGAKRVYEAGAFKKRYEHIRDCLVNKGVVLVREMKNTWGKQGHYEKLELFIPDVVAECLPALPLESEPVSEEPHFADWMEPVMEEIRGDFLSPKHFGTFRRGIIPAATLNEGVLRLGKQDHPSAESLYTSLTQNWLGMGNTKRSSSYSTTQSDIVDPNGEKDPDAIRLNRDFIIPRRYILNSVPSGHAARLPNLFAAFDHFKCPMSEDIRGAFIETGSRFGLIARVGKPEEEKYSSNVKVPAAIGPVSFAFAQDADGCLVTPLERMSLAELLFLGQISCLEIRGPMLHAKPSLVQLGRKREALDESRDAKVLWARSAVFRDAFETVKKRDKKLIVHSNVTVLKLGGPDIEAVLKAAYSDRLAPLGNGYYAVSRDDLSDMLSLAKKKGFKPKMATPAKGEEE